MTRTIIILMMLFSILGCHHPESKTYERNRKTTHYNESISTESSSSILSIDDNEENTSLNSSYPTGNRNFLPMEVQNGVRYVWIEINGIKLKFIFDTGASIITISKAEAFVLLRQGLLREEDIVGKQSLQDATGRISEGMKINLREVKIGDIVLENIEAVIIDNVDAPLLLGQSVLERFGSIEIDNHNNLIIFN